MLEYYRIDISEGIGVNKYEPHLFKYEPYLCNGFHDLMQKAMNFNDVAFVSIKRSDCRIHFWYISKDGAINIMKISNLNEKGGLL